MKKIILGLSILLFLTACNKGPEYKLDASDLHTEIFNDITAGNEKYEGETVEVTGMVSDVIILNNTTDTTVEFIGNVSCIIRDLDSQTIKPDSKTKITVSGVVGYTSFTDSTVRILNCEVIEVVNTPEVSVNANDIDTINFDDYLNEIIEITGVVELIQLEGTPTLYLESTDTTKGGIPILPNDSDLLDNISVGDTVTVKVTVFSSDSFFNYSLHCFEIENSTD